MQSIRRTVVPGALALLALALPPAPASADLSSLLAVCPARDAADNDTGNGLQLPYKFCDDGVPSAGGRNPNAGAQQAVAVPAAYTGEGDPVKDPVAAADVPGNSGGDVALDVDLSLPDPATNPMPPGGYPVVVFMHGCCSGNKTGWEATTIDAGGEKWHYSNAWFASRGYVVVTYTARGFVDGSNRGSTGETQLDSDLFEINDFQHLVGQLADRGDLDPASGGVQSIDPQRIVATGGSYGGGFSWMALTDPAWSSPGGTPLRLAAVAPKYGWTQLVESLVPVGLDPRDALTSTDPESARSPIGFPKRSIVAGLYAQGKTGVPPGNHTTFPPEIDEAFECLQSSDPYEDNPLCEGTRERILPSFLNERSAYYENDFFASLADPANRVPIFSAGAFTDPLFPASEHRRFVDRLKSLVPDYPVQEYHGDLQHFVQNKAKEWGDLCGADRHVCRYEDYPGGDLNAAPPSLAREVGITTRLNRFVDHYAKPPANPSQPAPAFDATASLQVCPQNAGAAPVDEPGERFSASSFAALAPNSLTITAVGAQTTAFNAEPNEHALRADPVANLATNQMRCPVESSPGRAASAGPGVATYDSLPLLSDFTMIGRTRVTVDHTGAGPVTQLNARLYDLFPDGTQVMVDRGFKRLESANGPTVMDLNGNGWRFPVGHQVRIELTQDDDPYIKSSSQPSSLVIAAAKLELPVRDGPTSVVGIVPPQPQSRAAAFRCGDRTRPSTRIARSSRLSRRGARLRGRASDRACARTARVRRVLVAVRRARAGRCRWLDRRGRLRRRSCRRPLLLRARGTSSWTLRQAARLPRGRYRVYAFAVDRAGNRGRGPSRVLRVR